MVEKDLGWHRTRACFEIALSGVATIGLLAGNRNTVWNFHP